MTSPTTEVALARTIGLRAVHAYLSANGWHRADDLRRKTADVYLCAEDERETAIVPASEEYGDYGTRIYQIAEQIGRLQGRPTYLVLKDLSQERSDRGEVADAASFLRRPGNRKR